MKTKTEKPRLRQRRNGLWVLTPPDCNGTYMGRSARGAYLHWLRATGPSRAQADAQPVGWRPAFPSHRGDFTRGVPSNATVEHLRAQGVEIEYAYSRPTASEAARTEELRRALSVARDHMRVMSNWIKFSDPAAYSWSCNAITSVNAVLERGEQE